ncbi:NAD(P)H-binding protein [Kitasatospora camelliae]|uniref:NAD(P)H-binding protein n=1 Tax=Kitasatospora camelliae TaxID=3156397 RepID=A0AAU8K4D5_9ACTN
MAPVLVTGATGHVGPLVVAELLGRGVPVRALVRDADRAARTLGPEVALAVGAFEDPPSLARAAEGAERMFLLCPNHPEQVEHASAAITAAADAGVGQIVMLSTIGAETGSPTVFFDQHGRIEDRLRAAELPWVVLRSAHLMANVLGSAATIREYGRILLPAGEARIAMTDPRDVAAAAGEVLTSRVREGRTHLLTGPEAITYGEVARRLSEALGRPVEYVPVADGAALAGLAQAGLPSWLAEQVVAVFGALRAGAHAAVADGVRELTGREPRGIAEFARWARPLIEG